MRYEEVTMGRPYVKEFLGLDGAVSRLCSRLPLCCGLRHY